MLTFLCFIFIQNFSALFSSSHADYSWGYGQNDAVSLDLEMT